MEHLLLAFTTFAFKTQRELLMDITTTKCLNGELHGYILISFKGFLTKGFHCICIHPHAAH